MISKQEIESRHRKFSLSWDEFKQRKSGLYDYEFDKYKIIKRIGSGSFATVYLGVVMQNLQQVAIKVIDLKQLNEIKNPRLKQIKLRLAHSQSRMMMYFSSQHIIKCYQTFQSQHFKFMILQYCDGGDLMQKIQKQGKLQQDEAISMLRQIANGLSECHSRGIIHRDLKPENIMMHSGVCKLADFGFSKMLEINTENQNQQCMNTTLGTPTTMAPQVKNFQPYGLKADIWSIGVIFFHMLFGKCPFESKQNFNKIMLRISGVLQKQQFYQGVKISDKVRRFLKQVLVVDPKQRLGWKGLARHEIFEQEQSQEQQAHQQQVSEQSSSLQYSAITLRKSCFQRQVTLKIDEEKMAKLQTEIVFNVTKNEMGSKQQQKQQANDLNIKIQQQLERQIQNMLGSLKYCDQLINDRIQDVEVKKNIKVVGSQIKDLKLKHCISQMIQSPLPTHQEQSLLYQWSRHAYFQCQKTEFIYNKIILPIQSLKLLQITQRKCIQFMYLLSTRCYNNMAPVYFVFQNNKNSQVIKQLTQLIQRLYRNVQKKWQRYSYLLTRKENEKLEIAADWTKRAIFCRLSPQSSYEYEQRQKFMTGIQCVNNYHRLSLQVLAGVKGKVIQRQPQDGLLVDKQQLHAHMKDYTRQEQIQYTVEYYKQIKDRFLNKQKRQTKEVMACLCYFSQICNLALEDLNNVPFKKYIQELLSTNNRNNIKNK